MSSLERFQQLVRDLFLPDAADLDFGLYRLLRLKRAEIEAFLTVHLPAQVAEALKSAAPEQQEDVYNHLYAFFSRYYEDGDFVPKRRYGARNEYALPYSGEETVFTWANRDQHYVKSRETFRDYSFVVPTTAGEFTVRFTVADADIPRDNAKGDTRYFYPRPEQLTFDGARRTVCLPFAYRLPVTGEGQFAILAAAVPAIIRRIPDKGLASALKRGEEEALLLKRLRHFTRRNTTDYFVHRDLRGFLTRELEYYIKDQLLSLGDLGGNFEGKIRTVRVLRTIAETVIDFLAQIEDVQRRLFEKRKLVLHTHYLVPVQNVPRPLWPAVLANPTQLHAWESLFKVDGPFTESWLEQNPTLTVDTSLFDATFTAQLLAAFPNLDDMTDGLLMHAENYQALRFMQEKYRDRIKTIFIDPPYNTGDDRFLYKDRYQHSSWLSMMEARLRLARICLSPNGLIFICISHVEAARLRLLCDSVFGANNFVADIAWEKRYTRSNNAKRFYSLKDTLLVYRKSDAVEMIREPRTDQSREIYTNPDSDPRGPWITSSYVNPATKEEREKLVYPVFNPVTGARAEHPTHAWKYSKDEHDRHVRENRLYWGLDGSYEYPRLKLFLSEVGEGMVPVDVWDCEEAGVWHYEQSGTTDSGGMALKALFGGEVFDNPKPPDLVQRALSLMHRFSGEEIVLDFFAGSGTTGHAVINMNREAATRRKFVLVEMGEYFDTVLKPRIQKVMYSPAWSEGRPLRRAMAGEADRTPRLVKVIRLEAYEDALHNLAVAANGTAERAEAYRSLVGDRTYCQNHLMTVPLAQSLSLAALDSPGRAPADLPETFSWLYGLTVARVDQWVNPHDNRQYKAVSGTRAGRKVLVLWREIAGLDPAAEQAFLLTRIQGFDEVLINGDTATPGVTSLNDRFHRLLEAGDV